MPGIRIRPIAARACIQLNHPTSSPGRVGEERQLKGTLKSRRAFQYIYDHGRRAIGAHVVVFAAPDAEQPGEERGAVGIVASRKVGHSPDRSRAKRLLRAALRDLRSRREVRGHVILVARRALIEDRMRSPEVAGELESLLEQAGALQGAGS